MGKRELLIIIAFVLVGAVVYQVTAPPPKPGERSFSIRQIFGNIKREISSNNSSASVTKSGAIKLRPDVSEIRVSTRSVPLTIQGEDREDIAYDFPVESTGPDEASARAYAEQTKILEEDLGPALGLKLYFPEEGTQHAQLTLRVPAKLMVRIENTSKVQLRDMDAADLRNLSGEVAATNVGALTGSHRSGELTITGGGKVDLMLSSTRARIRDVTGSVQINGRNGECSIANGTGTVTATLNNVEFTVAGHTKGSVTLGGEGGRAEFSGIGSPLNVDVRRMTVEVEVPDGSSEPISIFTSDEDIRLALPEHTVSIDAVVTERGKVKADDFGWKPQDGDRESRLIVTVTHTKARAVLRNARGDIVITRRK